MLASKHFVGISIAAIVILALSVAASLLPASEITSLPDESVLTIVENQTSATNSDFEENMELEDAEIDFLLFKLKPANVEKDMELAEIQKQESLVKRNQRNSEDFEKLEEEEATPTVYKIAFSDAMQDLIKSIEKKFTKDKKTSNKAISKIDMEGCENIENPLMQANCKSEIYFQKAIAEKNPLLCYEIINPQLKTRCESRFAK